MRSRATITFVVFAFAVVNSLAVRADPNAHVAGKRETKVMLKSTGAQPPRPLTGVTVRCCIVAGYPHVIPKFVPGPSQPKPLMLANYSGLAIDFFSQLLDHSGLACERITHFRNRTGTGHNDFIEDLTNCAEERQAKGSDTCQCDIGIGAWFETKSRVSVKFLSPYIHDEVKVAVHSKEVESEANNELFFINAFDPEVWGALLLLIVIFVVIKLMDPRFASRSIEYEPAPRTVSIWRRTRHFLLKNKKSYRVRRAIQSTLSNLLGFCFIKTEGEDRSTRQWILNYIIALVGLFIILTYEATMTATLVSETATSKFRSRNDLDNCRITDNEICFLRGDFMEKQWDTAFSQSQCRIAFANSGNDSVVKYNDIESMVEALKKRRCRYMVASGGQVAFATESNCHTIITTGRGFLQRGLSMVVPQDFPYFDKLNNETIKLFEERQNLTSIDDFVERGGSCPDSHAVQLQIGKMKIYFIVAFSVCLLLLAEMLLDPQEAGKEYENGTNDSEVGSGTS